MRIDLNRCKKVIFLLDSIHFLPRFPAACIDLKKKFRGPIPEQAGNNSLV